MINGKIKQFTKKLWNVVLRHSPGASYFLVALVMSLALANPGTKAYSRDNHPDSLLADSLTQSSVDRAAELIRFGKQFLGRPYRFRNPRGEMMDCSGFMRYIFAEQGISLPRTGADMGRFSTRIAFDEIRPGDLLFFKGRSTRSSSIGHVAVVTWKEGERMKFLHSCQRGVVIDDYPAMAYYRNRFLYAGRIPALFAAPASPAIPDSLRQPPPEETLQGRTRTILGVGDIMLGTNYPSASYLPPCDGHSLLQPLHSILQDADLSFGNLEGVLLSGRGTPKSCVNPANCFAFKSPDHYAEHLKTAGFDLLSLANNHIGDFGTIGKSNTTRILRETGIEFAGLKESPSTIFTRDGVRYGFCAFAPFYSAAKMNDYDSVRRIIRRLDRQTDIVIVSFHGGGEGRNFRNVTGRREYYLGEDRGNPREFARLAIEAGADIVFGHGPHVSRSIEIYRDRFIAYSLGNFATYGRFNLRGSNGVAPVIKVKVREDGSFLEAQIYSIQQPGAGGPLLDPQQRALEEIRSLTAQDFPHSRLQILDSGLVHLPREQELASSEPTPEQQGWWSWWFKLADWLFT